MQTERTPGVRGPRLGWHTLTAWTFRNRTVKQGAGRSRYGYRTGYEYPRDDPRLLGEVLHQGFSENA